MSEYITLLITLLYESQQTLMQCALKFKCDEAPGVAAYPMEPEYRAWLHAQLPSHVQSLGPIVAVEEIFEATVIDNVSGPETL